MIATVLDLHPDIAAHHEPKPRLNTEAYLRWSGEKSSGYVHGRLARKRDDLIMDTDDRGRIYVESSHFLSHLIPELRERYGARFVHLYRDGRHFVRSGLERLWYKDAGVKRTLSTWLRRRTGLPFGIASRDHRLDPPPEMATRFEKTAWLWTEINRVILDALDDVPDVDMMAVKLEAFGPDAIRQLQTFLGLDADSDLLGQMRERARRRPNRTEDRVVPPPEEWEPSAVERFWGIAGKMMKELGYRHE